MHKELFEWIKNQTTESSSYVYEFDLRDISHMRDEIKTLHNSLLSLHAEIAKKVNPDFTYMDTDTVTLRYNGDYYKMSFYHHEVAAFAVRYLITKPDNFYDLTPEIKDKKLGRALYILVNKDAFTEAPDLHTVSKLTAQCVATYLKNYETKEVDAWLKSEKNVVFLEGHPAHINNWKFNHGGCFIGSNREPYIVIAGISNANRMQPLMKYYKKWF